MSLDAPGPPSRERSASRKRETDAAAGVFHSRVHRTAARSPVPRADETPPRIATSGFFFDVVDALAARDAAAPRARQSQPHASHAASHAAPLPMSLVAESRRHLARWATRAAVRPMAIIPESHQVKEKKDAQRVDFFGDQQAIDSRCVRTRRASQSTVNDVPRRRAGGRPRGPGANRPHLPAPSPQSRRREIRPANDHEPARLVTHLFPKNIRPVDSARQVRAPGQGAQEGQRLRGAVQEERQGLRPAVGGEARAEERHRPRGARRGRREEVSSPSETNEIHTRSLPTVRDALLLTTHSRVIATPAFAIGIPRCANHRVSSRAKTVSRPSKARSSPATTRGTPRARPRARPRATPLQRSSRLFPHPTK
jgi:hypothetical protein